MKNSSHFSLSIENNFVPLQHDKHKTFTIMKKIKIEILCDEFYVADSLHELATNIECGDVLEQMNDENGELEVNGNHYVASIKENNFVPLHHNK